MKYYLIAGEASGDLHGSRLMHQLKKQDPEADFRFWGGDQMAEVGGTLVKHFKDLAFMGFWEVLIHLKTILKNIRFCKEDIAAFQPDVILYIDYPGFNLRIAQWAKKQGFKNFYYISPQLWAWKENRIKQIKKCIDSMYVILPFEQPYYEEKHGYKTTFVGHPLIEIIRDVRKQPNTFHKVHGLSKDKPIVALLPGSRAQEIKKMMPLFLSVVSQFPEKQFVIAGAPGIDPSFYNQFSRHPSVFIVQNDTYGLLKNAFAAIVTSGTATLETALFGVPQMVCYKSSWVSYFIAKNILTLTYISLVNLIMDKEVVKEIIQNACTPEVIANELKCLSIDSNRNKIRLDYDELEQKLGALQASKVVASDVISQLIN